MKNDFGARFFNDQSGTTAIEYGLIAALISVVHRWDGARRQWVDGSLQLRQRGHHACSLRIGSPKKNYTDSRLVRRVASPRPKR